MSIEKVAIGNQVEFNKTIGETDIYMFAGITGDFARNHVDEDYMRRSGYGRRVAHGALMVGFMSTASSLFIDKYGIVAEDEFAVSLGYDRVRFLKPVFIGDTIRVRYQTSSLDLERSRAVADVTITNQDGETVAVAQHILKWLPTSI